MVIGSKLPINVKLIFHSLSFIKKELFLFLFFLIVAIVVTHYFVYSHTVSLLIFLILLLLFVFQLIRKRIDEISEIKKMMIAIRKGEVKNISDINLTSNLEPVESEIREMYSQIKNDIDYLKKLERMRKEFLGNVSHELRTPIFAIQGYIETLLNGAISDTKVNKHFLEKANNHTVHLSNLVNDLIDISMIETGEMRMSFRYFYISDYIHEVISDLKPFADEKKIELRFVPTEKNIQVFGDRARIKQVLTNLTVNAIKYTEVGSVTIELIEENKNIKIVVRDTGIGIPPEDLPRIFERFFRVDKERSKDAGGTGLGLAIVKHIVEAHTSKVEVVSKVGVGTEFSFRLKK